MRDSQWLKAVAERIVEGKPLSDLTHLGHNQHDDPCKQLAMAYLEYGTAIGERKE